MALLVAYSVLTGGMVVEFSGGFKWTSGHAALRRNADQLQKSVRIVDESQSVWVPFILTVFYSRGEPYPIEIQITDNTQEAKQLTIETIEMRFETDNQKHILDPPWTSAFTSEKLYFGDGNGPIVEVPVVQVTDRLPVTVDKGSACHVRLLGTLDKVDGTRMPFELGRSFRFQPKWRAYTFWSGLHD